MVIKKIADNQRKTALLATVAIALSIAAIMYTMSRNGSHNADS